MGFSCPLKLEQMAFLVHYRHDLHVHKMQIKIEKKSTDLLPERRHKHCNAVKESAPLAQYWDGNNTAWCICI